MYTFHSKVRYSETNSEGFLSLPSIVNYFQDCSTFQSENLGVGVEELKKKNRAWLMNSWQVVLNQPIPLCEDIAVSTWAYEFKGFYGYRNFMIQNKKNVPLAYANSIWVYVDTKTGHPCRCPKEDADIYPIEPAFPMEHAPRKIALPDKGTVLPPLVASASYIDTNQHVNNCGYVRMAVDCLPKNFTYKQMRAEYRNAAFPGDLIFPSLSIQGDICTVTLASAEKKPYAILEFGPVYKNKQTII